MKVATLIFLVATASIVAVLEAQDNSSSGDAGPPAPAGGDAPAPAPASGGGGGGDSYYDSFTKKTYYKSAFPQAVCTTAKGCLWK